MSNEISETTEFAWRRARPLVLAALIGVAAGLSAAAMEWGLHDGTELLIGRFMPKDLGHLGQFRWGLLLLPALGGLLSGLLLRWLCPAAKGHGTEALTRSFHHDRGVMPVRGPVTYAASSVVVIASGGSAGPEGPVAALRRRHRVVAGAGLPRHAAAAATDVDRRLCGGRGRDLSLSAGRCAVRG